MNLKKVIGGCSWFERVWAHPESANYNEWFAVSSVLYFAEKGNELFHEWSSKHPKYDYVESQQLWEQVDPERARRTCDSVASSLHGAVDCESCPFRGGIHSPVELGLPEKRIVVTQTCSLPTKAAQAWAATYAARFLLRTPHGGHRLVSTGNFRTPAVLVSVCGSVPIAATGGLTRLDYLFHLVVLCCSMTA